MPPPRTLRPVLDAAAGRVVLSRLSRRRGGVLYRPELARLGVPRWLVQGELRARRWQRTGRQTVVTHNAGITAAQRRAVAVLEVGPRAALDGTTALEHHGVHVKDDGLLHVIAPKGSTPRRPPGVRVHESRRFDESAVSVVHGVRCVVPATAAVHAALWTATDRQAQLFVILIVQQRAAAVEEVAAAVASVARHRRKRLLARVVDDVSVGVRSLGELDVARAMRRHGLPEPDRQVLRRRTDGHQYLDCRFDRYRLTIEIDGVQHDEPEHRSADLRRDLALIAEGDGVIRIPLVVWRLDEALVLEGLAGVFRARGWRAAA